MQLDPTARRPGRGSSLTTRSARPTSEALRSPARASAGRCGSSHKTRPRAAAAAAATWVSEPGNLYASLLLTDPSPPDRFPELSFVAALALHDAVTARIPGLAGRVRAEMAE